MAHILREEPPAVFEYDGDAKTLYYRLTREPVARTVSIGDRVMVDVDAAGEAVGIEVMDPPGFTMTVSTNATARSPFSLSDEDIARARATPSPPTLCPTPLLPGHGAGCTCTGYQDAVDFIAKGHLGTPCPRPRDGGMCGCDEGDDEPQDCLKMHCDHL